MTNTSPALISQRRYLGVTKSNLCKPPKTLAYELIEGAGTAIVRWDEEVDFSIEEALQPSVPSEDIEALPEADQFLQCRLAEGPVPAAQIFEEAAAIRLSEKILKSAKKRLRIVSRLVPEPTGRGGHWAWQFPPAA